MITVATIQAAVAAGYGVSVADLTGERRTRQVVRPRQIAMFLSRRLTTRSFPQIGRRFGDRDHTTVIHACHKVEELRSLDSNVAAEIDLFLAALSAGEEPQP